MDSALNQQLLTGKPELVRLNAEIFGSIYYTEPEVSGVSLFAKKRSTFELLRNAYGSGHFRFRFYFLSMDIEGSPESLSEDAPILPHRTKSKMIPSSAKGKKAATCFTRIAASPISPWVLWEASVDYLRMHQVRVHAALLGIPLMGDSLYGGEAVPIKADFAKYKRVDGRTQKPLFEGIPFHLSSVCIPAGRLAADADEFLMCAELPREFYLVLGRLQIQLPEVAGHM